MGTNWTSSPTSNSTSSSASSPSNSWWTRSWLFWNSWENDATTGWTNILKKVLFSRNRHSLSCLSIPSKEVMVSHPRILLEHDNFNLERRLLTITGGFTSFITTFRQTGQDRSPCWNHVMMQSRQNPCPHGVMTGLHRMQQHIVQDNSSSRNDGRSLNLPGS